MYAKKSIYVIHYPKEDNVAVSYGLISQINEKDIFHLCSTEVGSSGAPILSLKSFKVIGIHYGYKPKRQYNLGAFIKSLIFELNNYNQHNNNLQIENYNHQNNINICLTNFGQENNIFQNNFNYVYQINNFTNLNNNINNQNIKFNNQFNKNNNNLFHQNIDNNNNNMIQNNNNNDIIMIEYDNNANNENNANKEKVPIKIMKNSNNIPSVIAFPDENDFINIIFNNYSRIEMCFIIPRYKHIYELFNIYAEINKIELNKLHFFSNGHTINSYDQRQISEVFTNIPIIWFSIH